MHTINVEQIGSEKKKSPAEVILKIILFLILLYIFFVSIELLGKSFKFLGKDTAKNLIHNATANPIVGLLIGMFATAIIQSSSTTTSMVVGVVAGGMLSVPNAIPIIMGANIGTTITNLIVSLVHIKMDVEYKRALSAAIVHDFFNIIAVIILLPLQIKFNIIGRMADFLGEVFKGMGGLHFSSPLKLITKPVIHFLIEITHKTGWILIIVSFVLLFFSLTQIVKLMKSLIIGKVERFFTGVMFKNEFRSFLLGLLLTATVQSSSVTTSLIVPIAAAGILTLKQIFPYTLGANVGTTITAILASIATGNINAIIVAFSHLSFNILGIAIIYPFKKVPLTAAENFANLASKKKIVALIYVISVFFIIPGIIIYLWR